MTHPPYGDDERAWGQGRAGRDGDDTARRGHQPPPASPPYGPPPHGGGPYGQPPYGSPGQQYGPPGQPAYGQPSPYAPPQQYGPYGRPAFGPPQYGAPGQQYGQSGAPGPYGPASSGPPGGWGHVPPPRRSRRGPSLLLGLLALVAIVAAGTALPGLLSSTALDPRAVQRDVAEQFEQREGVRLDLRCGDRMTVETGRSYECQGTTADGEPVTITITIAGEDASYTWSEG